MYVSIVKSILLHVLLSLLLLNIASCTNELDVHVENSLKLAGENRSELEKVLRHYENDKLKLQATKFLIANMDVHFSYASEELDEYYEKLHAIFQ